MTRITSFDGESHTNDFRSIKTEGVQHVMKLFMKHVGAAAAEGEFLSDDAAQQPDPLESMARETQSALALVCEEEALAKYSDG